MFSGTRISRDSDGTCLWISKRVFATSNVMTQPVSLTQDQPSQGRNCLYLFLHWATSICWSIWLWTTFGARCSPISDSRGPEVGIWAWSLSQVELPRSVTHRVPVKVICQQMWWGKKEKRGCGCREEVRRSRKWLWISSRKGCGDTVCHIPE